MMTKKLLEYLIQHATISILEVQRRFGLKRSTAYAALHLDKLDSNIPVESMCALNANALAQLPRATQLQFVEQAQTLKAEIFVELVHKELKET